jgi:hypothetical protein
VPGLRQLASVATRHSFYNLRSQRCADLHFEPSPITRQRMAARQLLFRAASDGFAIYSPGSADSAAGQAQAAATLDLAFELVLDEPAFVTITKLPLRFADARNGLYASNTRQAGGGTGQSLCTGTVAGEADLLPVSGTSLTVDVPAGTASLTLVDRQGEAVLSVQLDEAVQANGGLVRLALGGLAFGRYAVQFGTEAGAAVGSSAEDRPFLFLSDTPQVIGWLDLSIPAQAASNASDDDARATGSLDYLLSFDALSPYWSYFVMSRDPAAQLTQLAIQGGQVRFQPRPALALQSQEQPAGVLVSSEAIALREKSDLRLTLTGRRVDADGLEQAIELQPLPLPGASSSLVYTDDGACRADIFVYV